MKLIDIVNGFDLTGFKGSDTALGEQHQVVGELSDFLQRLFGLLHASCTKVRELTTAHNVAVKELELEAARKGRQPSQEDATQLATITELRGKIESSMAELENIRNVFWSSARLEYPVLLEKPAIHVVDGFKLAWSEVPDTDEPLTLEDILDSVLSIGLRPR